MSHDGRIGIRLEAKQAELTIKALEAYYVKVKEIPEKKAIGDTIRKLQRAMG